ncbi:hypothetical protein SADUNF_Sadunf03G0006900 [Salix dunnii]|uniref:Uncharacterized protein n=1 Tax=Salix dunnii TaxID=1413687 RepID=A0A835N445_9ROSI|nr:hypothetical protein SADUNF_Sadunf03G0006900 [Salix dunnii]
MKSPSRATSSRLILESQVANSELVSLAFQASMMQHQHRALGNNRDVAFKRRNNANNMGTKRVMLPKSCKAVIARSFDDCTHDHVYGHWLVAGIKKYPSKVNQAISGNMGNNGGDHVSASSNSTWSRVAIPLDQLASESCMQMQ